VTARAASSPYTATGALLVAWSLLALGDSAREGEFSVYGLVFVVASFAVGITVVARRSVVVVPDRRLLALPVAVCVLADVLHPASRNMHADDDVALIVTEVLAALAAVVVAIVLWRPAADSRVNELGLLAAATVVGVVTILVAEDPHIDVWTLLQQSSTGLLHGDDMYRQTWHYAYRPGKVTHLVAVYPYLPGTTLLLAPFRWVLGDVRYGLLVADLLTAYFVRRLAPAAPVALAGLLLAFPHWTFLVDQSWTEPLLLAGLAGAVLALVHDRPWWAVVGLAVALACKQHVVLLLPLFACWPGFGLRRTVVACVGAGAVVAPWVVAGPSDFWHDAVHANLVLGVVRRALCIPSGLLRLHVTTGFWLPLVAILLTYAVLLTRAPRTPSGLALGCSLVLLALDLTNKQSFFNHYTLPLGLLVVALAAAPAIADGRAGSTGASRPVPPVREDAEPASSSW
jgi:hypothetical protein